MLKVCDRAPERVCLKFGFTLLSGVRRMELVNRFIREDDGQDVVEYGLLIATIAIVVLIGVGFFGKQINAWFTNLAAKITTVGT